MDPKHLIVRFSKQGLPYRIERLGDRSNFFLIPKVKRLITRNFMLKQPQNILRKGKSSWEVVGNLPSRLRGGEGRRQNSYRAFLSGVKSVLGQLPTHELRNATILELQSNPRIKAIYDQYFKHNPEFINHQSIVNAIASSLLGYDNETGAVRESIADVRKKRQVPVSAVSAPSLITTQENEFDRLLLLVFNRFLATNDIPEEFLKSHYFTLRAQLHQVFSEDPGLGFRARLEHAERTVQDQITRDYRTLVNEVNRAYLSRYPFEDLAQAAGVQPMGLFSNSKRKLDNIKQLTLAIPGAMQKFAGLEDLSQTYAAAPESRMINIKHFMRGLQGKMSMRDSDFIEAIFKNNSRMHSKVISILEGKSIA